jgi:tetratricopeptide (TPR) repeat protein
MATTLAETYYLKALEDYPWELSAVMENLTYALSYDDENAAANCLMGQLQMNQLKNYSLAEEYFEKAISYDPSFACAYEQLVVLHIRLSKFRKAQRVLKYAQNIPSMNRSFVLKSMALILEKQAQFKLAKRYLKSALLETTCKDECDQLETDVERVKTKLKMSRKNE